MRALSWLLYWLGDLVSRTLCRWGLAGSLYQKLMLWSVECDKNFEIWKEVKPREKTDKNSYLSLDIHATKARGKININKVNIRQFASRKKRSKRK